MAVKIIKTKHVPRDERPEYLAELAALPEDPESLGRVLLAARATFHDAVLAGHLDQLEALGVRFHAACLKMHGQRTGCFADESPARQFLAKHDPAPGRVPKWGEPGEFLLEVEGMRVRVKLSNSYALDHATTGDFNVVDLDRPFLSSTGYHSLYLIPSRCAGLTVDQAARAEALAIIDEKSGKGARGVAVEADAYVRRAWKGHPAWLSAALAGESDDGQLSMFGEPPAPRAPLSGAERQKRRRDKLRELREQEGLKPVMLTELERLVLRLALDLYNDFNSPSDFEQDHQRGILQKLEPGADWMPPGQRQADRLRSEAAKDAEYWKGLHKEAKAESSRWAKRAQDAERTLRESAGLAERVRYLEQDNAEVIGERGKAFAAVEVLQKRLRAAGLSDDWRA